MKSAARPVDATLPVSTLERLDQICDGFETAWLANERPCLEEFLGHAPPAECGALLGELLKVDLEYRRRQGEHPTVEEYALRFPEHARRVGAIFAADGPLLSPTPNADGNLLFGILALQMDFINRDQLIAAMNAWIIDKTKPLGQILLEQGHLSPERRQLLEQLLKEHLSAHDHDPHQSLAAVPCLSLVQSDLTRLSDADVQSSLSGLPPHPNAPRASSPVEENTQDEIRPAGSRYRILRRHAKGGLGEVFLAEDLELHREVALKEIQAQHAHDPYSRGRFLLEAKITGGLEHPGIVPVYGMGLYEDGRPYYAMRLIKGDNLKEAIARFHEAEKPNRDLGERSLAFRQLLGRFIAVCNAVAYAHSRGVIHRDLKPANILLGKYGETLVVDWGLAKVVGRPETGQPSDELTLHPSAGDNLSTQVGAILGTPTFMGPEQAAGHLDTLGPASDIYGLGATLYVLLTGQVPIPSTNKQEMLEKVRRGDWLPPRQVKKEVPAALDAICRKAMALLPEDRYPTALHLAADVEKWLADEPVKAHRESYADQAGRWMRRHRTGVTAAVGNVLLMAAYREAEHHRHRPSFKPQEANSKAGRPEAPRTKNQIPKAGVGSWNLVFGSSQRSEQADVPFETTTLAKYYTNVSESKELKAHVLEPMRRRLLEMALEFYQQFMQEESDPEATAETGRASGLLGNLYQAERGRAYSRLADLYSAIGRHEQAEEAYRQTLTIFQSLADARPHVPEYQKDLAGNFNNLGALYSDIGRNPEAKAAYQKALVIQRKLAQTSPHVPEYQRDLAGSYNNLGVLHAESGKFRPAETAFQKALSIRKRLLDAWPQNPEYKKDLAGAYKNLGAWACKSGRWPQAETAYLESLAVQKKLAHSQPDVIEQSVYLGATYSILGHVMKALGKLPSSITRYSEAIRILKQVLKKQPRQGSARKFLCDASWGRAKVLACLGRHDEAIEDWEQAIELDHGPNRSPLRLGYCKSLVLTGSHHRSIAEASDLIKGSSLADGDLFDLATVFSAAAAAARRDLRLSPGVRNTLAERYAAKGVELLERIDGSGFFQEPKNFKLLLDKNLNHLRSRAEFKKLTTRRKKEARV